MNFIKNLSKKKDQPRNSASPAPPAFSSALAAPVPTQSSFAGAPQQWNQPPQTSFTPSFAPAGPTQPPSLGSLNPADLPGFEGHFSWSCAGLHRATHDLFISSCDAIDADQRVCRYILTGIVPTLVAPQPVHAWLAEACNVGTPPERAEIIVKQAVLNSKVVVVYLSNSVVQFLAHALGPSGGQFPAFTYLVNRLICEWETALANRNKLIVCPLYISTFDVNMGTSVPFNPGTLAMLSPGRAKSALEALCQIQGPNLIPEEVGTLKGFFEDRLSDWNSLAASLMGAASASTPVPPMGVPPGITTPTGGFVQTPLMQAPSYEAVESTFRPSTASGPPSMIPSLSVSSNFDQHTSPKMSKAASIDSRQGSNPGGLQSPTNSFAKSPSVESVTQKLGYLSVKEKKSKNRGSFFFLSKGSKEPSQEFKKMLVDVKNLDLMAPPPQYQERASRQFTWKTFGEAILAGEMLVVGAGRYVYDISSWINLHPGGSVILNYVTGTDITNDYFNESPGFDASHFVPESKVPMMRSAHNPYTVGRAPSITNTLRSSETDLTSLSSLDGEMLSLEQQLRQSPISEEDWKIITNTRRIHQHSKTAIAKLVEFLVGEIVPEKPVVGVDRVALENGDVRMYDPYEFRRYCMTRKALLTPEGAQFPVYLLRFSLLYPHSDVRVNEPEEQFRPGQCVEIQIKTNKGLWVSRYYSPLSGTTTCFEIAVKVVPNGTMSTFLTSQKPGVKQTKIRGPFGTVLEPGTISKQTRHRDGPRRTRSMQVLGGRSKTISRLIYISAGSGIAPFLQYINDTYLCVGKVMYAFAPYAGEDGSAYLDIQPGDAVFIKFHYGDGWGFGINVRTGQEGEFPASVLVPLSGLTSKTGARAILVNAVRNVSDIFGAQSLLPAVCAFPSMVSATHVVSASGPTISDEDAINKYGGTVFQGKRVDLELLEKLVAEPYDEMRQDGLGSVSVVVCGPPAFEQMVYDQLVDELGILHEDITMLPPSSYWNVESYGQ